MKTKANTTKNHAFLREQNQARVVIENMSPAINHGEFPIKTVSGQHVHFEADILCDGHDVLRAELIVLKEKAKKPMIQAMTSMGNDRWQTDFSMEEEGKFSSQIRAWVDWP